MIDSAPAGSKPPRFHQSIGRRLRGWLVAGILVVVPLALTAYIVWELIGYFDSLVERWIPSQLNPGTYLPFKIPGYGVVVVALGLTLIGAVTASLIGRWAVGIGDRIIARTPLISGIYGAIKEHSQIATKGIWYLGEGARPQREAAKRQETAGPIPVLPAAQLACLKAVQCEEVIAPQPDGDRKSTRLNSSH